MAEACRDARLGDESRARGLSWVIGSRTRLMTPRRATPAALFGTREVHGTLATAP